MALTPEVLAVGGAALRLRRARAAFQHRLAEKIAQHAERLHAEDSRRAAAGEPPRDPTGESPAARAVRRAIDLAAAAGAWGSAAHGAAFWRELGGCLAAEWVGGWRT